MVLEAIRYSDGALTILDQLALPHQEVWERVRDADDGWHAIRSMKVRGAPAIAIVAALSVAAELLDQQNKHENDGNGTAETETANGVRGHIVGRLQHLLTSRPTAVNLADAVGKLTEVVEKRAGGDGAAGADVRQAYVAAAEKMLADDVSDNTRIGEHGARWILGRADASMLPTVSSSSPSPPQIRVMTHCNTGSLATAGYGTALGIVRSLHAGGRLAHTYYGETRPYNQGSRLTGYELLHDGIPATLVTDSMAAALMAQRGPRLLPHTGVTNGGGDTDNSSSKLGRRPASEAPLVAVVVGADRVAANGDTANKIGTYGLAVLARHHGLMFVVAAPRTTIDLQTASGADIVIEERKQREVTVVKGPTVLPDDGTTAAADVKVNIDEVREVSIAPAATTAWNPAFDVTPAELIDAIVTEHGVVEKDAAGNFDLRKAKLFGAPS